VIGVWQAKLWSVDAIAVTGRLVGLLLARRTLFDTAQEPPNAGALWSQQSSTAGFTSVLAHGRAASRYRRVCEVRDAASDGNIVDGPRF
jgi:hypothetical protein